ncbi:MAG: homoserine dehydrogenase [archaeon]|nr:homoserine dehydrogenase [archaeon]
MLLNAELYVRDLPGQLVGSLEPISMVDGNIIGVVHDRERNINQRIMVSVTFEVANSKKLEELKAIWKSRDIIISKMGSVYQTCTREFMMVGKFNATYIENLIEEASTIVNLESTDVGYSSKNQSSDKRTAMITAEVRCKEDLDKLDEFFADACHRDNMLYIRGL